MISDQERDVAKDALVRLKQWVKDTVEKCDADKIDYISAKTLLLTCMIDALMVVVPENADKETFLGLMEKAYDVYRQKRRSSNETPAPDQ